jgi:hypothetical protein
MSKQTKWWKLALGIVALLIAVQAAVSIVVRTRPVHAYLIAQLEKAFGRAVEVRSFNVRILPNPSLMADGVTVGEDPAFGNEYFLRAESLTAGLRWMGLARGHFEFGTVSLSRPSLILVRNAQGRWNLERWLPPPPAANGANSARVYGPPAAVAPANRLQRIEFDDGRINFKTVDEKQPFAFTGVSGNVEQMSPGRWQLQLEAQPWRSGVTLQSTGTMEVRGDLAGTSARLQPAQITLHWGQVSVADLFRLLHGQDYGVRGVFALDGMAKSGAAAEPAGAAVQPGEWTFSLEARAGQIHRWDLTEREDNPQLNARLKGRWNVAGGSVVADEMILESPKSNLRGTANFSGSASPAMEVRVDSAGIQAADLLAWYRAFHPDVDEGVTADEYFTGAMTLRGWPLEFGVAAFSSNGGTIKVPGLPEPLRVSAVRGGLERNQFVVEPARISWNGKSNAVAATKAATPDARKRAPAEIRNLVEIGFSHDFDSHSGGVSIGGHAEQLQDVLKMAAAFGRTLNHGWELTGGANAALRWEWKDAPLHGHWNGKVGVTKGQLQVAGLNQPLQLDDAQLEWHVGKRAAEISKATGFGATWAGEIAEADVPSADTEAKWKFHLHADHLDATELDRWVGPRARPGWLQRLLSTLLGGSEPSPAASEMVRRVNAEGELRVDEFTLEKLKLAQVRAEGSLRELHLEVREAEAQWAGGKVRAKMNAAFLPRPKYKVTAELDRVNLAQLPGTGRVAERLSGIASGTVHLETEGVGREELLAKLAGDGDVRLKNVEFLGWDVGASVADGAPHAGASRWAAGEGTFTLRERKIFLDGLRLDGGEEFTMVNGTVSFERTAELSVETASAAKSRNRKTNLLPTGHVLKISGPLDGPQVSLQNAAARLPAD